MLNKAPSIVRVGSIGFAALASSSAFGEEGKRYAAVAESLAAANVTLQQGLTASESQGQPISGKFEVDDGRGRERGEDLGS